MYSKSDTGLARVAPVGSTHRDVLTLLSFHVAVITYCYYSSLGGEHEPRHTKMQYSTVRCKFGANHGIVFNEHGTIKRS